MPDWDALDEPPTTPPPGAGGAFSTPGDALEAAQTPRTLDLWAMSDPARTATWEDLVDWVNRTACAYSLTEWPKCWHQHRGMVAEVLALRELHRDAYGTSDPLQVLSWHERLWAVYGRYRHNSPSIAHDAADHAEQLDTMRRHALDGGPGTWDTQLQAAAPPPPHSIGELEPQASPSGTLRE